MGMAIFRNVKKYIFKDRNEGIARQNIEMTAPRLPKLCYILSNDNRGFGPWKTSDWQNVHFLKYVGKKAQILWTKGRFPFASSDPRWSIHNFITWLRFCRNLWYCSQTKNDHQSSWRFQVSAHIICISRRVHLDTWYRQTNWKIDRNDLLKIGTQNIHEDHINYHIRACSNNQVNFLD